VLLTEHTDFPIIEIIVNAFQKSGNDLFNLNACKDGAAMIRPQKLVEGYSFLFAFKSS